MQYAIEYLPRLQNLSLPEVQTFKSVRYSYSIVDSQSIELDHGGGKINVDQDQAHAVTIDMIKEKIRTNTPIALPAEYVINVAIHSESTQKLYKNKSLKKRIYRTGIYTGLIVSGILIGRAFFTHNDSV